MPLIQRQQFNPATGQIEIVFVDTGTGQTVGTYGGGQAPVAGPQPLQAGMGMQPGGNQPNLAVPSGQAPQGGFAGRHPGAASFLQNLGPALQALNFAPQEPTPYPVTGFSQAVRSIGQGAQTYGTAKENIQKARVGRATKKAGEPALQKLEAGTPLSQMTAEDQYGLQLAGVPAPQTTLSGAERGKAERIAGGLEASKAQQDQLDLQKRQMEAADDYHLGVLGLQKDEFNLRKKDYDNRRNAARAEFVGQAAIAGLPGDAAIDLFNSAYLGQQPSAETLKKLEDSPSAQMVRAQSAGFAAKARGQQLIGSIVALIEKKPNLTDDDKLAISLALQKINTLTDNPSIFMYNPNAMAEYETAIKTIEKLLPEAKQVTPEARGWFSSAIDSIKSALGMGGGQTPGPGPEAAADRNEYDALVKEAQANGGKLTDPAKIDRIKELAAKFKGQ